MRGPAAALIWEVLVKKEDVIASSALFRGIDEKQLPALAEIAESRSFRKGEVIFFEADPCIGFYLVVEGKVKIYKLSPAGKEHILHIFTNGEPFGEVPVFHGQPFPANAMALSDIELLFFPRASFVRLVEKNPSLALNMLGLLSLRLRAFVRQIENLSLKELPSRLAQYLLYLSEEQNNRQFVELEISKGQLASLLGTIPETLSRVFAKLNDRQLIRVSGKTIHILDREGLELSE